MLDVREPRTVETSHGTSDLAEIVLRSDQGASDAVQVTLWGKWSETVDHLTPGMEILVTDVAEGDYRGEPQYATTRTSAVIVEPEFLVDVTELRGWVQCPRIYYLEKLTGIPLKYPVVKGTIVHEVFGDLLRGRDREASITEHVKAAALGIGLLGETISSVTDDIRPHTVAIERWLQQDRFGADEWRSEQTLISEQFGLKGRADAVRRGMPVELKTGKNLGSSPRFHDKVQAACYALLLADDIQEAPETGTLLYTKNMAVDRDDVSGDVSPAKEFSITPGFLKFILRTRNELAAAEFDFSIPTGYEADAKCEYCFEQDTCMSVAGRLDQDSKAGQLGESVPEAERAYFDRMYRGIETERRAVHREYRKLWEQSPGERADDDRALINLEPLACDPLESGGWELRARRPGVAVSKIREGDRVLASDGDPVTGTAELGTVVGLTDEIVVTTDEPLELRRVDVYPSELGVARQLTALHDAILQGDPDRNDVLFDRRSPEFSDRGTSPSPQTQRGDGQAESDAFIGNNEAQNDAVAMAVHADDYALIHGPPGTGKTYTLARTVQAFVERGDRVLVAAFTNRAVDNAVDALIAQGWTDVVRWGSETGVREDLQDYRLSREGVPGEQAAALQEASVVAATTAGCGSRVLKHEQFDVAVVDEAAQLTEAGTFLATNLANRFVLVGDHNQLPPVVRADASGPAGVLHGSLFERLIESTPSAAILLDQQYRMNQRIQYFPSTEFYEGQLRPASADIAGQQLEDLPGVEITKLPSALRDPVTFIDPEGTAEGNTNPVEAERVAEIVDAFQAAGVAPGDIGVIAPYRAQVAEITRRCPAVTVDTVDRFQGSSKEVIVISFVATEDLSSPIFDDHRRVNVALTRAKKSLVLVGDDTTLRTVPVYRRMLEWAQDSDG